MLQINFGKHGMFPYPDVKGSMLVYRCRADARKISYAWQYNSNEPFEKINHLLSSKCYFEPNDLSFARFKSRNRFFCWPNLGFLARECAKIIHYLRQYFFFKVWLCA